MNSSENSLYQVEAKVHLEDNPIGALHVITPSLEVAITGNKKAFFSYAKQTQMLNGLNEGIVKTKAINALSEEIKNTFLEKFYQKSLEIKKKALPLHSQFETGSSPREWDTTSSLKRLDFYTVQEASTEKY